MKRDRLLQALERATNPTVARQIYQGYTASRLRRDRSGNRRLSAIRTGNIAFPCSGRPKRTRAAIRSGVYDFAYPAPSPNIGIATARLRHRVLVRQHPRLGALFILLRPCAPNEAEMALSREMQRDLAGFARTGKASWPSYDSQVRSTKSYDIPKTAIVADPRGRERRLWDRVKL